MPRVRKKHQGIIAILCSDIHLSHKAPIARSAEPDWYAAMARPLMELNHLGHEYRVPIVCAGDVFDHWKSPPELINFAIKYIPKGMYAVPGQHDLAYHSIEDIRKSAYWTLVEAGVIENLPYGTPIVDLTSKIELLLWGFPWGFENNRVTDSVPGDFVSTKKEPPVQLAVVHAYNWMKGKSYPGAPVKGRCIKWRERFKDYTASVFGDNHKGFTFGKHMMNCGTFMRRKIDEIKYHPQVGLLNKWGRIIPHYLDTSMDKFIDAESSLALVENGLEMGMFLAELAGLGDTAMNFSDALIRYCVDNGIDKKIRKIVLEAMERKE